MEVKAVTKNVRITPRKARLVADMVRKMSVSQALITLPLVQKRAAGIILKTLKSAIANATNNAKLDRDSLVIKSLEVKEAPFIKRMRIGSRSHVKPYKLRASEIEVILDQKIMKAEKIEAKVEDKKGKETKNG